MLALYPPAELAARLAVDDGLEPADIHLTVCYTGSAADVDAGALNEVAGKLAASTGPLTGTISGHARFTGGDSDVIVALADSAALETLRAAALDKLAEAGIDFPRDHGYCPHLTLRYIGADDDDPVGRLPAEDVSFAELRAVHGEDVTSYPFAGDITQAAAEAYAAGWALSGGPWTDRVAAGAVAAAETAREHAGDPHVLETTLIIGSLEGTMARFFQRRQDLTEAHTATVLRAWETVAPHEHAGPVIDRLRAEVGPFGPLNPEQRAYLRMLTGTAAGSLLAGVYAHDRHSDLQAAVEDALRSAMAEGKAGVLALNAEKHGHTVTESDSRTYSWDAAYQAIYDRLANLPSLPLLAQQWIQRMLAGCAADVGRLLARLFEEGASRAEMATAVTTAIEADGETSAAVRAVTAFTQQAMAQAMSQASLDLYASEGLPECSFITAGDDRVCPICDDYEENNPYSLSDCPVPAIHPGCRCVVVPADDVAPFKALAAFLA